MEQVKPMTEEHQFKHLMEKIRSLLNKNEIWVGLLSVYCMVTIVILLYLSCPCCLRIKLWARKKVRDYRVANDAIEAEPLDSSQRYY